MPNIVIYGLDESGGEHWRQQVFNELCGEPFIKELVVTCVPSTVRGFSGESFPFAELRFANDMALAAAHSLSWHLQNMGLDVEMVKLEAFRPRRG